MHSSRMRTARLLTVSHSIRKGCRPLVGVSALGVSTLGGCLPRGRCVSQSAMGQTPPPITLPQTSFVGGNKVTTKSSYITGGLHKFRDVLFLIKKLS